MSIAEPIVVLLLIGAGITAFVLLLIFVLVPLLKGLGSLIGSIFAGIGWLFMHVFGFIGGMLKDIVRCIGGIPAFLVLGLLTILNVLIGRWSAAGHFAEAAKRECQVASACLYRIVLQRPLRLLLLGGLLEGIEQRLPEAMNAAPTSDTPHRHTGQFDGYQILGSLRAGGSGAKLYVAEPLPTKRAQVRSIPDRVVIKSFALSDGSSLPQIVRESRALECAKQLGHVVDHGMDAHRFYYVMPYIPGDHVGLVTRQLHGQSDGEGLGRRELAQVMHCMKDLLATLSAYHQGGLWHKDVKPENIIIHDGRAHLVDLGLVTSLKSAMTLTTHGTEYFRDPEMVRLALRGVKVHQVDGAKFDIYGVGAVLYFMVENTFPAHGGLSGFTKRAPESLRWIIRRAMADYHKRYVTAASMLADLEFVSNASDPFAVRPAELPSMRGQGAPQAPHVQAVNATGMNEAEAVAQPFGRAQVVAGVASPGEGEGDLRGFGVAAGFGASGAFAQVGQFHLDADGNPIPKNVPSKRPKLRITNWWTGEYALAEPIEGIAAAGGLGGAGALRAEARHVAAAAKRSSSTARLKAREQVAAARQRAAELRARAKAARHRSVAERQPSLALIGVTLSVLLAGGLAVAALFSFVRPRTPSATFTAPQVAAVADLAWLGPRLRDRIAAVEEAGGLGRGVFVMDAIHPHWDSATTRRAHDAVAGAMEVGTTIKSDSDTAARLRPLLPRIRSGAETSIGELDRILAEKECSMLVVYTANQGEPFMIYHPLAAVHAFDPPTVPEPPAPLAGTTLMVINDHPSSGDGAVAQRVESLRKHCEGQGYEIIIPEPQVEAEIRLALARWRIDGDEATRRALEQALAEHGLGGLLHITARPGGESPEDRTEWVVLQVPPGELCPDTADLDTDDADILEESAEESAEAASEE